MVAHWNLKPARLPIPPYPRKKQATEYFIQRLVVRETGLEPVWKNHTPLKRARLPVPPLSLLLCSGLRFTPLCPCDGIYHTTSFPKCQYLFSIFSKIFSSFFTAFFKSHFATPSSSLDRMISVAYCFRSSWAFSTAWLSSAI